MEAGEFDHLDLAFSNGYEDFRLTFSPGSDGGYCVVATVGDSGPVEADFELEMDRVELQDKISRLGSSRSTSSTSRGVLGPIDEDQLEPIAQMLGRQLTEAVMRDRVKQLYDKVHGEAEQRGGFVRMRLVLTKAPDLLDVPWEFMNRDDKFLASQRMTPIVRELDTRTMNPPVVLSPDEKLRILVVISSPIDLAHLNADQEKENIERALSQISDRVEVTWLGVDEPCGKKQLREVLQGRTTFHILHFIGHGAFSDAGQGVIYLTDRDGNRDEVRDRLFIHLVGNQRDLQLVVLNSCEGASSAIDDPYKGFAGRLVKSGCDAVVAMQFEITDAAAIEFAGAFYRSLLDYERPIDQSLADARLAIMTEVNRVEWATPVLFLRDGDGILFKKPLTPPVVPLIDSTITSNMATPLNTPTDRPDTSWSDDDVTPKSSKRRRRWIIGGVASAFVIGLVIWLFSGDDIRTETYDTTANCINELFASDLGSAAVADPEAGASALDQSIETCDNALQLADDDDLGDRELFIEIDDRIVEAEELLQLITDGIANSANGNAFDDGADQQRTALRMTLDEDFLID